MSKNTAKTNGKHETRELRDRVLQTMQTMHLMQYALHTLLVEDDNECEAFVYPVKDARELLEVFYRQFLCTGGEEDLAAIARGDAVVQALSKTEWIAAAHAKATKTKARPATTHNEVMPTAPIDIGIFDLENDRDDLVKAMGQLTAARHDIMGAFSEGDALDEVFRLLANVKAGLENAHGALVDAGVVEAKG